MRDLKQNWRDIFKGFKTALGFWQIALAFVGLVVFVVGWWVVDFLANYWAGSLVIIGAIVVLVYAAAKLIRPEEPASRNRIIFLGVIFVGLILASLLFILPPKMQEAVPQLARLVLFLLVWGFFGGALARIATVKFATNDTPPVDETLKFALRKYSANLGAPISILAAVWFLGFCIMLGQFVIQLIPFLGVILAIIIVPLILIAAFIITLLAIGAVAGFPMMYPTVAAEGTDAFEAVSQAYGFVYTRPIRYVLYGLLALALFAVSVVFVILFAGGMVLGTYDFAGRGGGDSGEMIVAYAMDKTSGILMKPVTSFVETTLSPFRQEVPDVASAQSARMQPAVSLEDYVRFIRSYDELRAAKQVQDPSFELPAYQKGNAWILAIGFLVLYGFVLSFLISLFFSFSSIIYLLMRKETDGTDMTEVYLEEKEEETLEDLEKKFKEEKVPEPAEEAPAEAPSEPAKEEAPESVAEADTTAIGEETASEQEKPSAGEEASSGEENLVQ